LQRSQPGVSYVLKAVAPIEQRAAGERKPKVSRFFSKLLGQFN
jgi:hypothetical protein